MLAPATPHIAEEFWNKFGGKDLLAALEIPTLSIESDDLHILAEEEYVKNIISSARNLRNLAERHSKKPISRVVIQTSPIWKSDLASEAIKLHFSEFDFKANGQEHVKSLEIFNEESTRGRFSTWNSITVGGKKTRGKIYTWSDGSRYLLSEGIDELGIISANSDFIASALGVENVEAYRVGEGEDVGGRQNFLPIRTRNCFPVGESWLQNLLPPSFSMTNAVNVPDGQISSRKETRFE